MSVGSARERILTVERSCNDPAYAVLAYEHRSCNLAIAVQLLHGHNVLVRGDLKYAVRRRIHYQRARFDVFFSVIFNNFRARIRLVANDFTPRLCFEFLYNFVGEAVRVRGQGVGRNYAGNLPVSYRSIFAHRLSRHSRIARQWRFYTSADAVYIEKS